MLYSLLEFKSSECTYAEGCLRSNTPPPPFFSYFGISVKNWEDKLYVMNPT